jgi:chromosome segregation ATPase
MANYYIQDKTEELNKRIDNAFTELDTQRNRMSGLTRECNELKQELLRLQEEQKKNLLWTRIFTGLSAGLWFILLILKFI